MERLLREVDARAPNEPIRAALLLCAHARIYIDGTQDPLRAQEALTRASSLAPDARFVSATWRWLAEQGADPGTVLQRTRAELRHVGDGRDRTALLWQIAAIEEHAAADVAGATKTMRELLALEPNDVGAWDALAALYLRLKSPNHASSWDDPGTDDTVFGGVIESLDVMAQATDDAAMRASFYGSVGALRDRYLDDTDGALAALRRAIDADNTNAAAQATIEMILLRRRAWDEYAKVIAAQAERTRDPAMSREGFERAGDIYAECIGDHARAAHCYVRAATLAELDPGPVEKLAIVLENAGRWEDATAAYERLLTRTGDPVQKAWTLVRLGNLHETRLNRPDDALAAYRLAVDAAPTFAPALEALLTVARARNLHQLAIDLEQRQADRVGDDAARSIRYASLAERVEVMPGDKTLEEACSFYERSLGLDPTNPAPFDALDRIYRATRQWQRLITLYEGALQTTSDRRRARALRLDLAELYHARMNQPLRAAELLREALTGPEDRYDTLVSLSRALADAGRWTEYVEALEAQAAMLTGAEEIAAVYRIGAALETRVKDLRRALSTYEVVLDRAPSHEGAARAIIRIHETEGRWEQVVLAERRLLDLATRPEDFLDGLFRIARINEERLGHLDEAIAAYSEVLVHAPAHLAAIAALERLLRVTGNYRRLAQVLQHFADATHDPQIRVRAMIRAATILELCMDDPDTASAAYARALVAAGGLSSTKNDPERIAALWGLLRLQETRGEWSAVDQTLTALLETTEEPTARLRVLVRLARTCELRLGDIPRAAQYYEEANAISARGKPSPIMLDRVRVARIEGSSESIQVCLRAMAKATTDERLQAGLHRVLALTAEHEGNHEAAALLYERLVQRDPEDPQALDGYMRCVAPANDARLAAAIMARARATLDAPLRALLAFASGVLDETAGRMNDADVAYSFSLLAEPDLLPVLDASRRLRVLAGNFTAAASLAERSASASVDAENAAGAWLEAAELYETRLSDPTRALTSYRALFMKQPSHSRALDRALHLLEATGDWGTSATMLLAHVEAISDAHLRAKYLRQRAAILAGRLGDTPGAIIDLRRAMALTPDDEDVATMEVLAMLEERTRHWQEALHLHERVARSSSVNEKTRRRARLAQSRVLGDELRDDAKAKTILEELVAEEPDDRDTALRLAEVCVRSGEDARALAIYTELTTTGSATDRARALLALSDLKRQRPQKYKPADVEAAISRAFDLAIADPSVITLLEERAARDSDFRWFAQHADAAVGRVQPNTPGVLAMRTALARVLREKLKNPDAADRHLASAIQAFPESMATRLALAAGLRGRNDDAALAELRRAVEADPTSPGPFEALAAFTASTMRPEISNMLRSAAVLLGAAEQEDEAMTLANATPLRPIPESLLFEEAMARLVGPTRCWFLRRVLLVLEPWLPKIFPGAEQMLETRARLPDSYPIVTEVRAIANAVGVIPPPIVCRGAGREVAMLLTEPRALVLGNDLLTEQGRPLAMFHAAYACSRLAANGSLYTVPRDQVIALLDAAAIPDTDGTSIREFRKRISSVLPRKSKKELERVIMEGGGDVRQELAIWEAEEARRSLYTAVILCRDLRAVGSVLAADALVTQHADERRRLLAANTRLREVLELIASPACWDVFKRVYGRA